MKNYKKAIISLGTITAGVAPVAAIVSCAEYKDTNYSNSPLEAMKRDDNRSESDRNTYSGQTYFDKKFFDHHNDMLRVGISEGELFPYH